MAQSQSRPPVYDDYATVRQRSLFSFHIAVYKMTEILGHAVIYLKCIIFTRAAREINSRDIMGKK